MMVKLLYIFPPFFAMVLSTSFNKELQPNCTFDVKFDYNKDGNKLPNVSCFRTCDKDFLKVEQALNRQRFYYYDTEVEKKYGRMVEITVRQDGRVKCVLVPANTSINKTESVHDETKKTYLAPEKLVSKSVANCPKHYVYVKEMKTCLRFSDDEVTWNKAANACVADGGTLVIVDSEEKQKAFNSAAGSTLVPRITTPISKYGLYLWIGLSDIKEEGKFEWVDGSPLNYSRWFPKEPNNVKDNEDCVHIAFLNNISLWNDRPCEGKSRYVCEIKPMIVIEETTTTPYLSTSTTISPISASSGMQQVHICPTGWWKSNASETCYYIGEDGRTFDQSLYYCRDIGGTLATIYNSLEMQFIRGLMDKNGIISIWIGLTDTFKEGSFQWVEGPHLNYTSWGANQPDDWKDNEDCVAIDRTWDYLWIDMSCDIKVKQLCMRSPERIAIKSCPSGNIVARQVYENFLSDDLICSTQNRPTPSLVCIQEDGSDGTIDYQYLMPLVVVSALLGLHFFGFILVSFYFCKFYQKYRRHDGNDKIAAYKSGNPKGGEVNMAHYDPPNDMRVPPVPAPFAVRKGGQDGNIDEEYNVYDGPEYDTERYGSYVNPRVK